MNVKLVMRYLGYVLLLEAGGMALALITALIYGQGDAFSFVVTIAALLLVGFLLKSQKPTTEKMQPRDGMAIVAIGWLLLSLFGAAPFVISGAIPSPINAFFEAVSGFTTTGATILTDVEALPNGILFWRSFTHWMGGMGVLVLMLAIIPFANANTVHIMRAESPGPTPEKLVPKMGQAVKVLYLMYLVLTAILVVFLLFGKMPLFDALIHAFGTAGTGGFSSKQASVGAYNSAYIDIVITIFMALFGVNFSIYFLYLRGDWKAALKDEEWRFYFGAIIVSTLLIAFNTFRTIYPSFPTALRHASFQVSSIITTTGYATTDFTLWPVFSQLILLLLMFLGASAGSTGGGLKCIRVLLLLKMARREIARVVHPNSVQTIKLNGKTVKEETLSAIALYFFTYMMIVAVSVALVCLDGIDLITSSSAVFSAMGNIGPGLGLAGPAGSFDVFSPFSKVILSICMLLGRLEIYPLLVFVMPSFWKATRVK